MRVITSISTAMLLLVSSIAGLSPILAFSSSDLLRVGYSTHALSNNKIALPPQTTNTESTMLLPVSRATTTNLHSTTSKNNNIEQQEVDVDAITKYVISAAVQMSAFYALLNAMDWSVSRVGLETVPLWANCAFFYACSLKSRVFNPLSNDRPKVSSLDSTNTETIRPSWTPPGVTFPIMWLLIIGPLRAYSASLVVAASGGEYATPAILAFLFHLTIGDVWNTINNVEKRYGPAALGVGLVWCSAANAAYQYYQVDPFAGQLLSLTLVWLTIAATLVGTIWQLNPDPSTGQPALLYPVKGTTETEFAWFGNKTE